MMDENNQLYFDLFTQRKAVLKQRAQGYQNQAKTLREQYKSLQGVSLETIIAAMYSGGSSPDAGVQQPTRSLTLIYRSTGSKSKNCTKGKPCGGSCISKAKACTVDLSPVQKTLAIKARNAMKKGLVGDAVDLPPTGFSPVVLGDHPLANSSTISKAFQSIKDDENRENIERLENFIQKNGIKSVFYLDGLENDYERTYQFYLDAGGDRTKLDFTLYSVVMRPKGGALGHTNENKEVVTVLSRDSGTGISPNLSSMREGIESDLKQRKKSWGHASRFPETGEEAMLVYLHELGHQVHFKSGAEGNRPAPSLAMMDKSQTLYGRTNAFEYSAENFVAWAIAPRALQAKDKKAYDYIEKIMAEAESGRLRSDPTIPFGG